MTPTAYVSARLVRLAAEIRAELDRPTVKTHPKADLIAHSLTRAQHHLGLACGWLGLETAETAPAAPDLAAPAESRGFVAMGYDGFGGPTVYAQDAEGTAWAGGPDGLQTAHRFSTRDAAAPVAGTRGGYALPIV